MIVKSVVFVLLLKQIDKLRELDYELAQLVEECVQVSEQYSPLVRFNLQSILWSATQDDKIMHVNISGQRKKS